MMMQSRSYRNAFIAAIILHLVIVILLCHESSSTRPVLEVAEQNQQTTTQPTAMPQVDPIKAMSVDSKDVMETVNRLKKERQQQKQAEDNRQKALAQQAESARKQRVAEQQRLEKLKDEAAKLTLAREKQLADEKRQLAEMKQKQLQLQKEQKEEAKKLAELKKKKEEELAKAQKEKEELAKAQKEKALADAKAKALAEQKRQAAAAQAAQQAEQNAKLAGEVDKYKALIINSISRQWILPENVAGGVSSQFRIRLAPDGAVLEVTLTRSSGDPVLDRSAQSAIYKASPLPVPSDPATFDVFRDISLTVRPENARG